MFSFAVSYPDLQFTFEGRIYLNDERVSYSWVFFICVEFNQLHVYTGCCFRFRWWDALDLFPMIYFMPKKSRQTLQWFSKKNLKTSINTEDCGIMLIVTCLIFPYITIDRFNLTFKYILHVLDNEYCVFYYLY